MYTSVNDGVATESFAPLDPLKLYLFHFNIWCNIASFCSHLTYIEPS